MKKLKLAALTITTLFSLFFTAIPSQASWQESNGKWRNLNSSAQGYSTGWEQIGGKWYLFDSNGWMLTGWQKDGANWYYMLESGEMVRNGWIGDYYLTSSGAMATNLWIGKYYVGNDGVWIPNYTSSSSSTANKENHIYPTGIYQIGVDIPAGEYAIMANTDNGYFEYSSDNSGEYNSIIASDFFYENDILTIEEGNYLNLEYCYAVPIANASLDSSSEGMFKIGVHLPAGEYNLVATSEYAYYEIDRDARHNTNSILKNDFFANIAKVSVSNGQYLKLNKCKIVR